MPIVPRSPDNSMLRRVAEARSRPAIVDGDGTITYAELDQQARVLGRRLGAGRTDLTGERVALLCRPGRDFATALLATWWAGAMAVPLHPSYPVTELGALLDDAQATLLIVSPVHRSQAEELRSDRPLRLVDVESAGTVGAAPESHVHEPADDQPALMVFTSGTTGRPKGVVHTHASLRAQIEGMVDAWAWSADDHILQVLPLHHVHGIVNVTLCPLWVGALGEAPGGFDPVATWERFASGEITVFMAVPTIYSRLLTTWETADPDTRARWSDGAARLRLTVSGSAALPVSVLDRWRAVTGQVLLERYGMTEVGMALGNTLDHRVPGHVGVPFPGVRTRLVDEAGAEVADGQIGELLLRGPQLFAGYWNRPDDTAAAFSDGWFRTGDVAVHTPDGFRLLGRASVDILKTGGEKVSALEIEEMYRTHPEVADCAVVGLPDEEWGDRVAMAVVARTGTSPDPADLRLWGKERLAPAKVPTRWVVVGELPRNAMGKVTKDRVREHFESGSRADGSAVSDERPDS